MWANKKIWLLIISLGILYYYGKGDNVQYSRYQPCTEEKYLNIYDWYGMLPKEVIQIFEQETGIKIRYDIYDNNEILEAKLLASNSGYDLVFPSASPYIAWQIQAKVYQPINKKLLKNFANLDPQMIEKMSDVDKDLVFAIPYYWGTIGILVDYDKLSAILPNQSLDSWNLVFQPEIISKISPHGLSFLEESIDVIPILMIYLGLNPFSYIDEDLLKSYNYLQLIRPYISKFTSSRFINDVIVGDTCVALAWSGESQQAIREAKAIDKNLRYILPKEGSTLWIDAIAIPVGASHPNNAHKFIDFLLRPEIAAKISSATLIPTTVRQAKAMLPKYITENVGIYPPAFMMEKLHLNRAPHNLKDLEFERKRTYLWSKIRIGKP